MRDILEMHEQMRKHRDIRQEFETEWSEILSVAEDAKDKAEKAVVPLKSADQHLLPIAEPFAKEFETQSTSPDPRIIAALFGRRAGGFCRSCGSKLPDDSTFCIHCGAKVR